MILVKLNLFSLSVFSEFRPPPMLPPNRGGGGASSSSSTSRTTTTRSPPYYTTPRPLLTTSPGQRHRTTTVRQPVLVPASGSSSDTNQIIDTKHKSGRSPPVQVLPPAPQPPALPPQEFCSPRVNADISWPRTQQGQTAKQPCPVGILGMGWHDGSQFPHPVFVHPLFCSKNFVVPKNGKMLVQMFSLLKTKIADGEGSGGNSLCHQAFTLANLALKHTGFIPF